MLSTKELTPQILVSKFGFEYNKPYELNSPKITLLRAKTNQKILALLCKENIIVAKNELYYLNSHYPNKPPFNESFGIDTTPQQQPEKIEEKQPTSLFAVKLSYSGLSAVNKSFIIKDVESVYKLIKSPNFERITNKYRELLPRDEDAAKKIKNSELPYITCFGLHNASKNESINSFDYNGLMWFDIDLKDNLTIDLQDVRNKLIANKYVKMLYTSPSGGVKFCVGTKEHLRALKINSSQNLMFLHNHFIDNELKDFKVKFDVKQFDSLKRNTIICHDDKAYYNPDSTNYAQLRTVPNLDTKEKTDKSKIDIKAFNTMVNSQGVDKVLAFTWCLAEKKFRFVSGEIHNFCNYFAICAKHYGIDYDTCLSFLTSQGANIRTNCVSYIYQNSNYEFSNWNSQWLFIEKKTKPQQQLQSQKLNTKHIKAMPKQSLKSIANCEGVELKASDLMSSDNMKIDSFAVKTDKQIYFIDTNYKVVICDNLIKELPKQAKGFIKDRLDYMIVNSLAIDLSYNNYLTFFEIKHHDTHKATYNKMIVELTKQGYIKIIQDVICLNPIVAYKGNLTSLIELWNNNKVCNEKTK